MRRIGIGGICHESTTFAPRLTSWADYTVDTAGPGIVTGPEILGHRDAHAPFAGFLSVCEELELEPVPLLLADAEPGGPLDNQTFDRLSGSLIERLLSAGPLDGLYLDLHGAMSTQSHDDGERELVRRIRAVAGKSLPIVASFDLHGNLDAGSLADLDGATAYHTYPHVDVRETGIRAARVLAHRLRTGRRAARAFRQIPFLMPGNRLSTDESPCRELYAEAIRLEATPGVLSVGLMQGFAETDVPHAGPSVFAYAGTESLAESAVATLYDAVMAQEHLFVPDLTGADEAARMARDWPGPRPLLLADIQDNPGGGSSSDDTTILAALLRHDVQDAALAMIHDPATAARAHEAGPGATIEVALGGKSLPGQSPLKAKARVVRLADGTVSLGGPWAGERLALGKSACLRVGGVDVVVTSRRTQCLSQDFFRHVGIEPASRRVLVVKSTHHYRADFRDLVGRIVNVESGGSLVVDPRRLPYRRLRAGVRLIGNGPAFMPRVG